jgi:hypothetical protein
LVAVSAPVNNAEGDGLINVASGGDNVLEIEAGEGGLPNNGLDAASLRLM